MSIILTIGWSDPHDTYMAVITDGEVQKGDENVTVLDVKLCDTVKEAKEWGREVLIEKPWETRQ